MVAGWIRATGSDFKFSLKIPKTVTHDKRLAGVEKEFLDFVDLVEPIARTGKLGCLLLQLPPDFMFKERERLESFFNLLPKDIHFAVEFRHESWNRKQTWDLLEKYGVANTITDSPIEFLTRPIVTATTHSYVRWHGRGKSLWNDYTYSEQELRQWLANLQVIEENVPLVYAYFNNHYRADSPTNLLQLLEMTGDLTDTQKKVKARRERYEQKKAVKKITDF